MNDRPVPGADLEIARSLHGTTETLAPRGAVDIASAPAMREAIRRALEGDGETVVVDLSDVTFLDSTGLHVLLRAEAHSRARGVNLILLPGPPVVQRVFELTGLSPRFVRACGVQRPG